jgi:hypothetical protein
MKNHLDVVLPEELLYEFLCAPLSRVMYVSATMDSLSRPCLTCFVATASVEINWTNILTIVSVMAGVGRMVV